MTNAFAFRATYPPIMMAEADPVGPGNDEALVYHARRAGVVVAAWGVHGAYQGRHDALRALLPDLYCLRLTNGGLPAHPLYLPKTLVPCRFGC
jgi:hypothetical protein